MTRDNFPRLKARLLEYRPISASLSLIRFAAPSDFSWSPGQYVVLYSQEQGGEPSYYSIASAPDAAAPGVFELATSKPSIIAPLEAPLLEEIWFEPPTGGFPLARMTRESRLVLIGMGTGIAPLRAVAQFFQRRPDESPRITILHGARTLPDAIFADEFSNADAKIDFRLTLSVPSENWSGKVGRVQAHLDELLTEGAEFWLCGSPDMVSDLRQRLLRSGVDESRIAAQGG